MREREEKGNRERRKQGGRFRYVLEGENRWGKRGVVKGRREGGERKRWEV